MTESTMAVFKTKAVATTNDEEFDALASGSGLPRLGLYTSNSQEVKDGDFPTNTYGLKVGEMLHNLGKNTDIVVCAYRLTAIDTSEGYTCSHDSKSDLFKDIMARADVPNSFGSGCMYGQEFLIWVPEHKTFATLLCGSKTSRNMASGIKSLVGEVATMGSKKLENKKYSWFAMTCAASNAAVTNTPDEETYTATLTAFSEDKGVERELAEEGASEGDDR